MELKDWIKQARTKSGLTLEKFGEAVGRTKANVHGWEKGLHEPSYNQVVQIAELAKMPPPLPAAVLEALKKGSGDEGINLVAKDQGGNTLLAQVKQLNRPDYAESISDTLGDSLMTLHGEMSRRAVEALGVLARAPDSPRARGELMDVLQHAKLEALAGGKQGISLELVAAQLRGAYAAVLKMEPKPSPDEFVKGFMDTLLRHNR